MHRLQSWNQVCFQGGYIEMAVTLPGNGSHGFWASAWTLGNLGAPSCARLLRALPYRSHRTSRLPCKYRWRVAIFVFRLRRRHFTESDVSYWTATWRRLLLPAGSEALELYLRRRRVRLTLSATLRRRSHIAQPSWTSASGWQLHRKIGARSALRRLPELSHLIRMHRSTSSRAMGPAFHRLSRLGPLMLARMPNLLR